MVSISDKDEKKTYELESIGNNFPCQKFQFLRRTHFNEELETLNVRLQSMLFQAPVSCFDLHFIFHINQNKTS